MKLSVKKAVYLDLCALERPYDDQRYYRISIETTAVQLIVEQVKQGTYTQYYSPVHLSEIARDSSEMRRKDITLFLQSVGVYAKPFVGDSDRLEQRGWELHKLGFGIADAFHVAYAEQLGADFISCDDGLLKKARKHKIEIWAGTPIDFCRMEHLI